MSINIPQKTGKLTIITGPMFAGKTTLLQKSIESLKRQSIEVAVFKPKIDQRYEVNHIVSHLGKKTETQLLESDEIGAFDNLTAAHICIDEFQFLDSVFVTKILQLLKEGRNFTISGLQKDYLEEDFGSIASLLPFAHKVFVLEGSCSLCNKPSTHTFRKIPTNVKVCLGGENEYQGLCKYCYDKESNKE